ncbi:unnamed protein product [Prunus armeniaca]
MARSDGGRNWGMYASSKSASLPDSLHINTPWFFRCFVLGHLLRGFCFFQQGAEALASSLF